MPRERLYLFDTTLRDGAQTNGVDFTLADKLDHRAHARRAGHRLCRGRLSGRQSDRYQSFCRAAAAARPPDRVRHDAAARPLGVQRSGPCRAVGGAGRRHLLRRQVLGLSRAGGAGDHRGGEPRLDPRQRARRQGQRPRGAARLRAFLRRLQGQSGLCARLRQGGLRRRRALGGAVRHQRRHAAARGGKNRRRGLQRNPRRPCRHSRA